jgi:hypothetical protein
MNASQVICIDFEPGIPAAHVAQTLRLPLLDQEITAGAARKLNVSEMSVATLEDEPDHPVERWILAAAEGDQAIDLTGARRQQWLDEQRQACADRVRPLDELDRAKRLYVKQALGRHWPDSRIYDLVIDVGSLPLEQSALLVAEYARSARGGAEFTQ